jgi:hypothetical protein
MTPARKPKGAKSGDPEAHEQYVRILFKEIDSMAFKTLTSNAVWLYVQIQRSWRGSYAQLELPFSRVSWKLTYSVFDKARGELIEAGFIKIVNPGGLQYGGEKNSAVYALSDEWKTKRIDTTSWYEKKIPMKAGGTMSVWYPHKKRKSSAANIAKGRAVLELQRARVEVQPAAVEVVTECPESNLSKVPDSDLQKLLDELDGKENLNEA